MMGSPAGNHVVTTSAKAIEVSATTRRKVEVSRGHNSPKKAAGTAASSPHDAGFPRALAPSAPSKVKRFQKRKTPEPVIQNPSRMACTPRRDCASATPVDSSIGDVSSRDALQPPGSQQGSHLKSVEGVARAEQRGRGDGAGRAAAGRHHADRGELAGAGKGEKREEAGLQDAESCGDAGGAEGHAVGTDGQRDTERVANGLAALVSHDSDSCPA